MDMLEKLIHPTDETAENIKSALTSSPGEYEAVPVDLLIDSNVDVQPIPAEKATVKIKGSLQSGFSFTCLAFISCASLFTCDPAGCVSQ